MKGDFPSPEILYVDSASSDGSAGLARELGARVIELSPDNLSAAKGRNEGWKMAKGEYILFLDGDTVLDPNFAEKAKEVLKDPQVAAVWGNRRETFAKKNFYHRVCDIDWVYPYGESEYFGGDVLIRRRALEEVSGYDESLKAGEEPEMCGRIRAKGYKIFHVDLPMSFHDIHMGTWGEYWHRAERSGYAYAEVLDRFPDSAPGSWDHQKWKSMLHTLFFITATAVFFSVSFSTKTFGPLLGWFALILLMILRTAHKARWKSFDLWTLLCYGVHSHLSKIPLVWGQIKYWANPKRPR